MRISRHTSIVENSLIRLSENSKPKFLLHHLYFDLSLIFTSPQLSLTEGHLDIKIKIEIWFRPGSCPYFWLITNLISSQNTSSSLTRGELIDPKYTLVLMNSVDRNMCISKYAITICLLTLIIAKSMESKVFIIIFKLSIS